VRWIVGFGRFWYDFIVGDDWMVAVVVAIAVGVTYALAHADVTAWWLLPVAVFAVLAVSVARAAAKVRGR